MPRKKLTRFHQINDYKNVFQDPKGFSLPKQQYNKVILEVGCGKGDYTLQLAKQNPDNFYIGLDKKGERIWRGATDALDYQLQNAVFIRGDASFLHEFFPENSIDEIWVTFPVPFFKSKQENRRLISPTYLDRYRKLLKSDNTIHLKTDHKELFDYTYDLIQQTQDTEITTYLPDIYSQPTLQDFLTIQTDFEKKHLQLGKTINYLAFKLKKS